jgi:iron donor protein CyaY
MNEKRYHELASNALSGIEEMLSHVDADSVDVERASDVMTLTFPSGRTCVINMQRPTRQIWLAANAHAWHFGFDEVTSRWLDDKGQGIELARKVAEIVQELAGIEV